MKKKYIFRIAIAVIAFVFILNSITNDKADNLDISLANVEALAAGELPPLKESCWDSFTKTDSTQGEKQRACDDCHLYWLKYYIDKKTCPK